ncbi:SAM-dependent methyltransferase [Patescibacteria group bacterium]|nr:SAM-dependent methyltransferase [Patescibacteria group bacterium]
MSRSRSIINSLPMRDFNFILDRLGTKGGWCSILATHLDNIGRVDLKYILNEKEFKNAEIQNFDFIAGLSVGEISALYEYSLAYIDRDKRKESGQFFTPDDVAGMMARKAALFSRNKIWIDPCSGVGNLSYWLIQSQKNQEDFLKNNIFLVDRDELALLIARFIFTINFQQKDQKLFNNIKHRFIVADFLKSDKLPNYDYAILNPPYVSVEPDENFETSAARDLYAYFVEKVIKTSAGFISITPQTFTNGRRFNPLRRLLINNFNKVDIYCFDNVPDNVFHGIKFGSKNTNKANSVRAGIIVARQGDKKKVFRITPLLRWKTAERQKFFSLIDDFLVQIAPEEDIFPKLQKELLPLYSFAKKQGRILAYLVSRRPTPYKLIIPSTPRYFISALQSSVNRSSFRTLYFFNAEERDIAYLLLNSSYMYWWWRVNDGGMTISEKTLLTLPLINEMPIDKNLLLKIKQSEKTNRVFKRNAGKDNENVKHDSSLIQEINRCIFPKFATALGLLHSNSAI